MRVLVACEWSNTVRDAFLARGHDAYSCDLLRAEHPNPNYKRHVIGDVRPLLKEPWDLVIAHPPCTYLCNSGVHWLTREEDDSRWGRLYDAILFFRECLEANSPKICVENPIMHGYAKRFIRRHTQVIHPWQFGAPEKKTTCLWLKGLPALKPTNVVKAERCSVIERMGGGDGKERSRTFEGVARAMSEQWG